MLLKITDAQRAILLDALHTFGTSDEIDTLQEGIRSGTLVVTPTAHQERVEAMWQDRKQAQDLRGSKLLDEQAAFLAGAIAARAEIFDDKAVPPKWWIASIRSEVI